jgi:imidazolonepropionase-like amidohydrolase
MWRTLVVSIVVVPCLTTCVGSRSGATSSPAALAPGDVWIQDVTLISAERQMPLPHAHVVVRGGKIASAGIDPPGTPGPAVRGVTLIKGAGKYLVPGLIDGHVHLAGVPGMTPEQEAAMPAAVAAYDRQLPRSYLYFGFTAVVDLNVVDRVRLERLRAADVGPAIFDCGNALALANGYGMAGLPPATRFETYPNFLYDARQASSIPKKYSLDDHSPEAAVGRVAAGGGVCVKAHYEPGFDPRVGKLPVPTAELMQQVREASHRRKLPLLLHANSLEAHRFAAEVRPDVVVHGMWNWGRERSGPELPSQVREVLDQERSAGIGMMPTSRVIGALVDLFVPAFLDDPRLTHVVPAQILSWYRSQDGQWFVREMAQGMGGVPPERAHDILVGVQTQGLRAAVYFARQGGRILFGSDTPSAPTYANPPGYNGYLELRELESAGISPRQLLAAATVENAHLFGLADYGTIEPGKVASLLLLRDDPLASTAAFDTIETVMVNGRVIQRGALSALGQ